MTGTAWIRTGSLGGAVLGLADCLLAATTGQFQRPDLAWIWSFDLVLGVAIGAGGFCLAAVLRRGIEPWSAATALLAVPVGLFLARRVFDRPALILDAFIAGGLIVTSSLLLRRACGRNSGHLPLLPFVAVACTCLGAATLLLNRHTIPAESSDALSISAVGMLLASCLLCALARAIPGAGSVVLAAATLGVGGAQLLIDTGSGPQSASPTSTPRSDAPNVLLVTLDTLRRDHLSCYGYSRPTSPSLDELSRSATLFKNAYATSPYTLSSHASLFTGLLPSVHGARPVAYSVSGSPAGDLPLSADRDTLAEVLGKRGYESAAFVANYAFLRPGTGLAQGFQTYDSSAQRLYGHMPLLGTFLWGLGPAVSPRWFLGWTKGSHEANAITDKAIAWLRQPRRAPFFLFLNYLDVHAPYAPPPQQARRFSQRNGFLVQLKWYRQLPLSGDDWSYLVDQYDAAVAFTDHELGRLIDDLRQNGLYDNTLIAVTSDHGEFLGEHGLRSHRQALYEPVLRIPMILKLPRQHTGRAEERLTTLADLHWLMREATGENTPEAPDSAARVVAEYWTPWAERLGSSRLQPPARRAVYQGPLKLIQASAGASQLFDLVADPDEQRDLMTSPEGARRAQAILQLLPPLSEHPKPAAIASDPDAERRLRSLGYIR